MVGAMLAWAMAASTAQAFLLQPPHSTRGPPPPMTTVSPRHLQQLQSQSQLQPRVLGPGLLVVRRATAGGGGGGGGGGWDDEDADVRFSMGSKHIDTGFLKVG